MAKFRNVNPTGDLYLDYGIGHVLAGAVFEVDDPVVAARYANFPEIYAPVADDEDPADV